MTKQHTPGPWEVRIPFSTAARFPAYIVSSEPNERFIAAMYGSGGDYDKRLEAAQNARLIAAAPELLEFAEEVRCTGDTRLASMAIAVIAKATGETK